MPYHVWTAKLAARATLWYRAYVRERGCTQRLLETQGIDPHFWHVFGPKNPFKRCLFHQMSYYQRVWMIKTMCDHLFVSIAVRWGGERIWRGGYYHADDLSSTLPGRPNTQIIMTTNY